MGLDLRNKGLKLSFLSFLARFENAFRPEE